MTKKKLIELLKSGDFTIMYWDREYPNIYKGRWNYYKEEKRDNYETMNKAQIEYPMYDMNGYCPNIVALLTEALGGKSDSI